MTSIAPSGRDRRGCVDDLAQPLGQQLAPADDAEMDGNARLPTAVRQRGERVGRDVGDRADLVLRSAEVLDRQRPEGHLADAEVGAPVDHLERLLGAAPMADAMVGEALADRPAAVAVHDHRDVARSRAGHHLAAEALRVDRVDRPQRDLRDPATWSRDRRPDSHGGRREPLRQRRWPAVVAGARPSVGVIGEATPGRARA